MKHTTTPPVARTEVLIVGSGGNGVAAAVVLQRSGIDDLLLISKHDDFGGAWLQNTYPGCEVDVPASVYQFRFALSAEWTKIYPEQPEVLAYVQSVAAANDLYPYAHFGVEMLAARWVDDSAEWSVQTNRGEYRARFLLVATGFLEEAVIPDIPGLDSFTGRAFHSSVWPTGYSAEGDIVGVVGSGSSGIQIVPALARTAAQVLQFQRTPTWVLPKENRRHSDDELSLLRSGDDVLHDARTAVYTAREQLWDQVMMDSQGQAFESAARAYLAEVVKDPATRRALTPDHTIGCKRPLMSDEYYQSLNLPHVTLVPEAVTAVDQRTVTTASGHSYELDTLVLATGFHFGGHVLSQIQRRDGCSVAEAQKGRPMAYKSVSVSGAPNLFLCGGAGPNGMVWPGMLCGEVVAEYLIRAREAMRKRGVLALEVNPAAELDWKERADERLAVGPVVSGGCMNYSLDEHGYNKAMWPGNTDDYIAALSVFDEDAYYPVA